jgi:hypothetical protein
MGLALREGQWVVDSSDIPQMLLQLVCKLVQ